MEKKISIIVPMYNVEMYLRKCIKSILQQTYKNIEVILVDDGSPDNCGKIADAFAKMDSRVKVIHQDNKGLCGARNAGLDVATGEYIGFIDSDDWISPDMYEYLCKGLEKNDADIVACRYYRVDKKNKIKVRTDGAEKVYNTDEAIENIVKKFDLRTVFWNKLFKKKIFDNIRFPEGMVFEGTNIMHTVIKKAERIAFLPDAKYYYVDVDGSIINVKNIKNGCDYVLGFIKRYNDLVLEYPNLQSDMMMQVIKNAIKLLSVLRKYSSQELAEYEDKYREIYKFIYDNIEYIKTLKKVNKITIWKLSSYGNINKSRLFQIHCVKRIGKKIKRVKKIIKKIVRKSKRCLKKIFSHKTKDTNKKQKFRIPMNDLTDEDIQIFNNLHLAELYILDELKRICNKHGLRYFLYGGTLLGAVRHKGFIPWDDDIDIVMPREDYDRFQKIAIDELGEDFFLQNNNTDHEFNLLFSKIRLNNTYVREEKFDGKKMHQGIFIDILPLDLYPDDKPKIINSILLEKFNVLNCACQTGRCISKHKLSKLLYRIYMLSSNEKLQSKRQKFIRNICKSNNTSLVCSFGSHYRPIIKRVLQREWFEGNGIEMEFEGKMYTVPNGWREYLEYLFGENYMELPPEDKRINHFNFYEVDFDVKKTMESNTEYEGENIYEKI